MRINSLLGKEALTRSRSLHLQIGKAMKLRQLCLSIIYLGPLVLSSGVSDRAYAQEREATALEEIVVTARKREENLQETPISVDAFTAESIAKLSATGINDVGRSSPNVLMTAGDSGGQDAAVFIRGIGQFDYFGTVDPGVAVYIDGIYQGRAIGGNIDPSDIERIEILKGPQGTLFGRNALGGAVNIVTVAPDDQFDGHVKVGFGERDLEVTQGAVNIPIIPDALLSHVSFSQRTQNGYVNLFAYPGKTDFAVDELALRASLKWTPNDKFTAELDGDYRRGRDTPPGVINRFINTSDTTPVGVTIPAGANNYRSNSPYFSFSGAYPVDNTDSWGTGLTLNYQLANNIALKSLTAYRTVKSLVNNDQDGTPYIIYDYSPTTYQNQISEELQLNSTFFDNRLALTTGLYFFRESINDANSVDVGGPQTVGPTSPVVELLQGAMPTNKSDAVFTQGTFKITDPWSITAGIRYNRDTTHIVYDQRLDNRDGLVPFLPPTIFYYLPAGTTRDKSWSSVTPKAGTEFKISDDVLAYFSYARGFRSGGFNGKLTPGEPPLPYDPETLDSYELGVKSEWFDKRLRLNGALWYYNYNNIQEQVAEQGFFSTANAGRAHLKGFELEVVSIPVRGLQINAGLGYTDAYYVSLIPGAIIAGLQLNDPLPLTPKWTGNLGIEYSFPIGHLGDITMRGDYSFTAKYIAVPNNAPDDTIDGYSLVNTRLSWNPRGGHWETAFYVKNVFNRFYIINTQDLSASGSLGVNNYWPGEPRTWGGEISYKF
jgi:iron complex outermembrane receptor protein